MEVRKLFKAGNSVVVSIPGDIMKVLGLSDGSHVSMEVNREKRELVLKPVITKKSNLSVDFIRIVDKLFVDYDYQLRRLGR